MTLTTVTLPVYYGNWKDCEGCVNRRSGREGREIETKKERERNKEGKKNKVREKQREKETERETKREKERD